MLPIIIEDVTDSGTQWFLSFDGPNPAAERSVHMLNRVDAEKAKRLIAEHFRPRRVLPAEADMTDPEPMV